jgi:multiple sugar transport system ATP-binding protein
VEAMTMGQRMAIMRDGLLQQCDEPEKVYNFPANKFVASFIGSPPMNFMAARIISDGGRVWVDADEFRLPLPNGSAASSMVGKEVTLGIRPEDIVDANVTSNVTPTADNTFTACVDVLEPLGHEYVAYLKAGRHNMVASISNETKVVETKDAKFAVNLDRLHIFDNESELAIR